MLSSLVSIATTTLALSAGINAAATPNAFSWESWVNDIIANPNGTHLSPEEAVAASEASRGSLISRGSSYFVFNYNDKIPVSNLLLEIDNNGGCNTILGRALVSFPDCPQETTTYDFFSTNLPD